MGNSDVLKKRAKLVDNRVFILLDMTDKKAVSLTVDNLSCLQ